MDPLALLAVSVLVFVLAVIAAWKLTWLLVKAFCWLIALTALATVMFWCVQHLSWQPILH